MLTARAKILSRMGVNPFLIINEALTPIELFDDLSRHSEWKHIKAPIDSMDSYVNYRDIKDMERLKLVEAELLSLPHLKRMLEDRLDSVRMTEKMTRALVEFLSQGKRLTRTIMRSDILLLEQKERYLKPALTTDFESSGSAWILGYRNSWNQYTGGGTTAALDEISQRIRDGHFKFARFNIASFEEFSLRTRAIDFAEDIERDYQVTGGLSKFFQSFLELEIDGSRSRDQWDLTRATWALALVMRSLVDGGATSRDELMRILGELEVDRGKLKGSDDVLLKMLFLIVERRISLLSAILEIVDMYKLNISDPSWETIHQEMTTILRPRLAREQDERTSVVESCREP